MAGQSRIRAERKLEELRKEVREINEALGQIQRHLLCGDDPIPGQTPIERIAWIRRDLGI